MFKRKNDGTNGAVTVFLAIVLVPCITITCIFADISRVQLSAALAESSADLALNNTLVNYDQELEQYYGMMASCQDMTDCYAATTDFFTAMVKAQGLSDEEAATINSYVVKIFNEYAAEDAVNMLATDIVSDAVVEPVGKGLGDAPALLEDQIIEFMKYRGPIEITKGIVDRLTKKKDDGSPSMVEALEEASEDEPLQEAKEEYANAQGAFLKQLLNSYIAIKKYADVQAEKKIPSSAAYATLKSNFEKIWVDYVSATVLITQYYVNADDLEVFSAPTAALNESAQTKESVGVKTEVKTATADDKDNKDNKDDKDESKTTAKEIKYYMDESAVRVNLAGLRTSVETINAAAENGYAAYSKVASPNSNSNVNPVQYCLQLQKIEASGGYAKSMRDEGAGLQNCYAFLSASLLCDDNPESAEDDALRTEIATAKADAQAVVAAHLSGAGSSNFAKLLAQYAAISSKAYSDVRNKTYTFGSTYLGKAVTVDAFTQAVSKRLTEQKVYYDARIQELEIAINGGGETPSLETLQDAVNDFTEKRESWGDTAKATDTSYGDSETALYEGRDVTSDPSEKAANLLKDGTAVQELKTRLQNIQDDMQAASDAIGNFKYGSAKISDITSADMAIQQAKSKIDTNNVSLMLSENETQGTAAADKLLSPAKNAIYTMPSNRSDHNPDLAVSTPALYEYMKTQFGENPGDVAQKVADNEKKNENFQAAADKEAEEAKKPTGVSKNNVNGSHVTSSCSAISALGGAIDTVVSLASLDVASIRDSLYLTEYVMDMFSYSSYEGEVKYNILEGKNPADSAGITLLNYKNAYASSDPTEKWAEEDPSKFAGNKSLTNIMINTTNNAAYGAEVEYVLYGGKGKSNTDVLTKSYANLFSFRLLVNTISGFRLFFTTSTKTGAALETIAAAIMAATLGVVPSALTKSLLILVLATLESTNDLIRLKNGIPVALVKLDENAWCYAIPSPGEGSSATSFDKGVQPVDENGLFYSDYLYLFLLINFNNRAMADDMLLRVGEVIETNMQFHPDGDKAYDLSNSYQYFKLSSSMKVKPLMLDLPIIQQTDNMISFKENDSWCSYQLSLIRGYS